VQNHPQLLGRASFGKGIEAGEKEGGNVDHPNPPQTTDTLILGNPGILLCSSKLDSRENTPEFNVL